MTASCINLIKMFQLKCINSCVKSSFSQAYTLLTLQLNKKKKYYWLQIIIEVFTLNIISIMIVILFYSCFEKYKYALIISFCN